MVMYFHIFQFCYITRGCCNISLYKTYYSSWKMNLTTCITYIAHPSTGSRKGFFPLSAQEVQMNNLTRSQVLTLTLILAGQPAHCKANSDTRALKGQPFLAAR